MPADPNQGEKAVQVTRNGGGGGIESPDGKYLYYIAEGGEGEAAPLMKVPLERGEETQVLPSVFRGNFAVADEGIYFVPVRIRSGFPCSF